MFKVQRAQLGSHSFCISLFVSKNVCGVCWCSQKKKERERKGRSFFKDVQNPKRKFTPKKIHPFFSSFFFHSFHFERETFFVDLSLSLSLFDVNDANDDERGFWWWWFYTRCFCFLLLLLKACDRIGKKSFFLSTT